MASQTKSETVPKTMQDTYASVVSITDEFSKQHLNDEYAQLIRHATAALCRKRPSPLASGRAKTWACGITHAIGMVNFLYDSSQQPHISAGDLYKAFGVSASSGGAKSKLVRDVLDMHQMDPDWTVPSKMSGNLMAWMIMVNGIIVDARTAPRPIQEIAYAQGAIPYIPDEKGNPLDVAQLDAPMAAPPAEPASPNTLYRLTAYLIGGPVSETFIKENPIVSRCIAIKGSNTLADLHRILFEAYDREEEHLYEFQIGGTGPSDPASRRYQPKMPGSRLEKGVKDTAKAAIATLGLTEGEPFGYTFDFGDDWWHQIDVNAIAPDAPKGTYPQITERVGNSPPQYADLETSV